MARALGELVTIGSVAQGNPLAASHAEQALALADQLGHDDLRGYALMYRGSERLATGDTTGSHELDEAIAILSASPRTDLAVRACVNAAGRGVPRRPVRCRRAVRGARSPDRQGHGVLLR